MIYSIINNKSIILIILTMIMVMKQWGHILITQVTFKCTIAVRVCIKETKGYGIYVIQMMMSCFFFGKN